MVRLVRQAFPVIADILALEFLVTLVTLVILAQLAAQERLVILVTPVIAVLQPE